MLLLLCITNWFIMARPQPRQWDYRRLQLLHAVWPTGITAFLLTYHPLIIAISLALVLCYLHAHRLVISCRIKSSHGFNLSNSRNPFRCIFCGRRRRLQKRFFSVILLFLRLLMTWLLGKVMKRWRRRVALLPSFSMPSPLPPHLA